MVWAFRPPRSRRTLPRPWCARGRGAGGHGPWQQFLDAEGLGDVVVGAGVEGFDLGALVIAHGENEHGVAEWVRMER